MTDPAEVELVGAQVRVGDELRREQVEEHVPRDGGRDRCIDETRRGVRVGSRKPQPPAGVKRLPRAEAATRCERGGMIHACDPSWLTIPVAADIAMVACWAADA